MLRTSWVVQERKLADFIHNDTRGRWWGQRWRHTRGKYVIMRYIIDLLPIIENNILSYCLGLKHLYLHGVLTCYVCFTAARRPETVTEKLADIRCRNQPCCRWAHAFNYDVTWCHVGFVEILQCTLLSVYQHPHDIAIIYARVHV